MRNKLSRIVAGLLALLLVLGNTGAVTAYAADNQSGSPAQEKVLTVTSAMTNANGILTVTGTWDRIIIPKEITASTILLKDVQAGSVEIESGLSGKVELASGSVGELTVVPAKLTQMTVNDLCDLIAETKDSTAAVNLYLEIQEQNNTYLSRRPTVVTQSNVTIGDINVSGNAKLNLGSGSVDNVTIDADGSQTVLDVSITNYNGNVSVNQTTNESNDFTLARVTFKNSDIETLVMEGEGNGNVVLEGQKTNITEVQVEKASMVSLNLPTETVTVSETASDVNLTILDKVEDMKISAAGTNVEVGDCGTVTKASVESKDVTIHGDGTLTDVEITGKNVAVSTQGTKVEGENAYVPPVAPATPSGGAEPGARDLGGLELTIVNWSYEGDPDTPEYAAQQAYRQEMMRKHNFTVKMIELGTNREAGKLLETATALGSPIAHVFLLDPDSLENHGHLLYDLSTLSELDFTEDKWDSTVTDMMTYKNGIYGMAPQKDLSGSPSTLYGVIYNKRVFEAAGLDPELPYTLQASGEWTWSKFKELCGQLTLDSNSDGVTDVYAMCSEPENLMSQLVLSTGSQLIELENGNLVNNITSDNVMSALNYVKELYDAGYDMNAQEEWIDTYTMFTTGTVAMQFGTDSLINGNYWEMSEDLGFVCCPKPDGAASYHIQADPGYVAVIPAFYDAKTASDIAFAYDLWTDPAPEYENTENAWKSMYEYWDLDQKAIDETLSLYYEDELGVMQYADLTYSDEWGTYQDFRWYMLEGFSPEETLQNLGIVESYEDAVATANNAQAPNVAYNPVAYTLPYTLSLNSDGTLTVTGSTNHYISDIVIPDTILGKKVTQIGYDAFYGYSSLKTITLPAGLQTIDSYAFSYCELLDDVVIPEGVTTIGYSAFYGCSFLENVTIPKSVTSISTDAFAGCSEELTFTVEAGSYAELYALSNDFNVVYMSSDPSTPPESGETGEIDLGGINIVIGDWYSYEGQYDYADYAAPETEALLTYRQAMMKKYNFTITQLSVSQWNAMSEHFRSQVASGNPDAQVYIIPYNALAGNTDLFYDLSTLSELDFSEDKWSDAVTDGMTYHNGIYGMIPHTGHYGWQNTNNTLNGIVFNKRLLEEAGIDPDSLYDLQKSGQWTWSKFKEICAKLTRDTNKDGTTDIYALASNSSTFLDELIVSTGEQLVEVDKNGNFVNNVNSDQVRSAIDYALELEKAGYIMSSAGKDWNYYESAFMDGTAAMQFTAAYVAEGNGIYASMGDELGFVCCPKPDGADSYHILVIPDVAVIPACYDAETAAAIAFAYNIWTNPAPSYGEDVTSWKSYHETSVFDDRAINETLALYYEDNIGVFPYYYLLSTPDDTGRDLYWNYPFDQKDYTLDKLLPAMKTKWDSLVKAAN